MYLENFEEPEAKVREEAADIHESDTSQNDTDNDLVVRCSQECSVRIQIRPKKSLDLQIKEVLHVEIESEDELAAADDHESKDKHENNLRISLPVCYPKDSIVDDTEKESSIVKF
jgi:hypothetical protein